MFALHISCICTSSVDTVEYMDLVFQRNDTHLMRVWGEKVPARWVCAVSRDSTLYSVL